MEKMNGLSKMIITGGSWSNWAQRFIVIAVAAEATVPSSSTSTMAWIVKILYVSNRRRTPKIISTHRIIEGSHDLIFRSY